ncbi:MAG: DUF1508 domain-containing protein [Bacteroidetes bacterium]|nr:DUF1508 domain-containing protein [Bacteroidota bacterium]MCW5896157.1 DUF1508 domain-containing protein [Bacteroidota bacterium]
MNRSLTRTEVTMIYHLFHDANTQWKWELRTNAGKLVAISGVLYRSKENCITAIRAVQKSGSARIEGVSHQPFVEEKVPSQTQDTAGL